MSDSLICNTGYQSTDKLITKARGNYLYDTNGQQFIDMAMGAGSLIFGHAHPKIVAAINEQADKGTLYLQNNIYVRQLSELIKKRLPDFFKHYIYCNTGSEATQRAIRLARAATGKEIIISFKGGWHGMNEWTLLDDGGRFDGTESVKPYAGIPEGILKYSKLLPYNDETIYDYLSTNKKNIAAIIIEPIQGSNPQPDIKPYLEFLSKTCKDLGILLIFDEIITGFRISSGGAISLFGVKPDIVTYGKVLGGGLPIGMLAFTEKIYQLTFARKDKKILTGGTFSANPLSCSTGLATLKMLSQEVYEQLNKIGLTFRKTLNEKLVHNHIPFHVNGITSISRLYFTDQAITSRTQRDKVEISGSKQKQFITEMKQKGIIWPVNGIICHATTQDENFINDITDHIIDSTKKIIGSQS